METEKIIKKDMLILQVLKDFPSAGKIFEEYNMGCRSCGGVRQETIERGCNMHGVDISEFIARLHEILQVNKR